MNQGTAASVSATKNSTTNSAMNNGFAWRAKCHRNPSNPAGGSGCSGVAVGFRNRSKRENIYCEYRMSRDVSTVALRGVLYIESVNSRSVILRCLRHKCVLRASSTRYGAGLEGCTATALHQPGRRPPISGLPEIGFLMRKSATAD